MTTEPELEALRAAVQETERQHIIALCGSTRGNEHAHETTLKRRKKYICVDVGTSGRYMIEIATDKVYGIKAYGVIHRGHYFGTVTEFTSRLNESLRARAQAVLDRMSVSLEAR